MKKHADGNYNRQKVLVREDCDTTRLYDSLDEAIKYLQEIKKQFPTATLEEHWTGYEDMSMCFSWYRDETDEEMALRIKQYEYKKQREAEEAEANIKKLERRKVWEKLKAEFGSGY